MLNRQSSVGLIKREVVSFDITLSAELTDWRSVTFTCVQTARADKAGKQAATLILTADKWLRQFLSVYRMLVTDSEAARVAGTDAALYKTENEPHQGCASQTDISFSFICTQKQTIYRVPSAWCETQKGPKTRGWADRTPTIRKVTTLYNRGGQKSMNLGVDGLQPQKTASTCCPASHHQQPELTTCSNSPNLDRKLEKDVIWCVFLSFFLSLLPCVSVAHLVRDATLSLFDISLT